MAIQLRRGEYAKLDASKLLPGEYAIVLDEKKVFICFSPGDIKEVQLAEDFDTGVYTQILDIGATSENGMLYLTYKGEIISEGVDLISAVRIFGKIDSVEKLPDAGKPGDSYLIDGHIYIFSGGAWVDLGSIVGPKGETGPVGPQGEQGPKGDTGGVAYAVFSVENGNLIVTNNPEVTKTNFYLENGNLILEV